MGAGLSNVWSDRAETGRCLLHSSLELRVSTTGVGHARATAEDKQMRGRFGEE